MVMACVLLALCVYSCFALNVRPCISSLDLALRCPHIEQASLLTVGCTVAAWRNLFAVRGISSAHRQSWSTFLAGTLWLLILFTTNSCDDDLFQFGILPAAAQVGMGLHLAALAALAGDAQLAIRLRHRARHRVAEDEIARTRDACEAARERNRAAQERDQAACRTRIQARRRSLHGISGFAAPCRFLLADTARRRLRRSEALAVPLEALSPSTAWAGWQALVGFRLLPLP